MQRKRIQNKVLDKARISMGKRCQTARTKRRMKSQVSSPVKRGDEFPEDYEEPVRENFLAGSQSQPTLRV